MYQALNTEVVNPAAIAGYNQSFRFAHPYPHIVFENFLLPSVATDLHDHFPLMSELRKHYKGLNENKSEGSSFDEYHPSFMKVIEDIRSEAFIKFMEGVTGIDNLSIPPDHRGSGVHQGKNGSFLDIHVDFSIHPTLKMHRRLNLLIFLNPNWKESYGGAIEMWDSEVKHLEKAYFPLFNRAVIFECNDVSYHGYDKISIPEEESRKSIYCYYYSPVEEGVEYHDTIFKARPSEGKSKQVRTNVKEGIKNGVKKALMRLGLNKVFDRFE